MSNKLTAPLLNLTDISAMLLCGLSILELNNSWFRYVCLCFFLLWVLCVAGSGYGSKLINNKANVLLVVYVVFVFAYLALCGGIVDAAKNSLVLLLREVPVLLFIYYIERVEDDGGKTRIINIFMLALCFVVSLNLLKILASDINAARIMAAYNNPYSNRLTGGGYQMAYALSIILPYLIYRYKKLEHKALQAVLIAVYAVTLIKCSYTLAILLSLAELFLLFYLNPEREKSGNLGVKLIGVAGLVVLLIALKAPFAVFLQEKVAPLFTGSFVKTRIMQIGDLLLGGKAENNGVLMRLKLYSISVKTFFEHPIFGISYKTLYNSALERPGYYNGFVGQHSSILDGFARFGIFYLIYIAYLVSAFKFIRERSGSAFTVVFIILIIIKLINLGDAFGMCYFTCFFIPFAEIRIREKEKTKLFYAPRQRQKIKNKLITTENTNGSC